MNLLLRKKNKLKEYPELIENPTNIIESILVSAAEEYGVFTDETIRGNLLTLLMAGEVTTALTISWMIILLASRPEVVEKIRIELDDIMLNKKYIDDYQLNTNLKYLEGCA